MLSKDSDFKRGSNEKVDILDTTVSDSEANHELHDAGATTLHRTMKNRHIAMIRCVSLSSPVRPPTLTCALQYRRCNWHGSLPGYRRLACEWRACRSPPRLCYHRYHLFRGGKGIFSSRSATGGKNSWLGFFSNLGRGSTGAASGSLVRIRDGAAGGGGGGCGDARRGGGVSSVGSERMLANDIGSAVRAGFYIFVSVGEIKVK